MHNSLERAAPGHTGFRPVEFLGHHFLQHYILPHVSSSLVSANEEDDGTVTAIYWE